MNPEPRYTEPQRAVDALHDALDWCLDDARRGEIPLAETLPLRDQFHRFLKKWAKEHGKEYHDVLLLFDEFESPEMTESRRAGRAAITKLLLNQ